jgi:hypothetical protein
VAFSIHGIHDTFRGGKGVKKTLTAVAFVVSLGAHSAWAQQFSPVQARLVIPDVKTLPGVPMEMWVDLNNPSDSAVAVGLSPQLIVRSGHGETFDVALEPTYMPDVLDGQSAAYVLLPPHGARTLTFPIRNGQGPRFFNDWRLSPPGRYTIIMLLQAPPFEGPGAKPYLGPVVTNEVTVERVEPTGTDAKVWQRMQEVANGHWSQDCGALVRGAGQTIWCTASAEDVAAVWNDVVTSYRNSNYVPYASLGTGVTNEHLDRLLDVIRRFPTTPVIDQLHLAAYGTALSLGKRAVYQSELMELNKSTRRTTRALALHER